MKKLFQAVAIAISLLVGLVMAFMIYVTYGPIWNGLKPEVEALCNSIQPGMTLNEALGLASPRSVQTDPSTSLEDALFHLVILARQEEYGQPIPTDQVVMNAVAGVEQELDRPSIFTEEEISVIRAELVAIKNSDEKVLEAVRVSELNNLLERLNRSNGGNGQAQIDIQYRGGFACICHVEMVDGRVAYSHDVFCVD